MERSQSEQHDIPLSSLFLQVSPEMMEKKKQTNLASCTKRFIGCARSYSQSLPFRHSPPPGKWRKSTMVIENWELQRVNPKPDQSSGTCKLNPRSWPARSGTSDIPGENKKGEC